MLADNRKRFAACLMAASELYGKTLSKALSELYWRALEGHDIDAVEKAFQAHIAQGDAGQFMPKPADIAKLIVGTSKDSSLVAWAKVDKAVRQVGPYASVTFDDPITMRVLQDMGGWTFLCAKDDEAWPFIGNEFQARYQGYRGKGEVPDYPPRLVGITEADNGRKGVNHAECVLIGDPAKAAAVRDRGVDKPAVGFQRATTALRLIESKGSA